MDLKNAAQTSKNPMLLEMFPIDRKVQRGGKSRPKTAGFKFKVRAAMQQCGALHVCGLDVGV